MPWRRQARRERRGDPDVHADHADTDAVAKLACGLPTLRKDRRRVGKSGALDHLDAFVQVADVRHRRDRPKDLFLPDRHVGLHAVEDGRPHEVTAWMFLYFAAAPVQPSASHDSFASDE